MGHTDNLFIKLTAITVYFISYVCKGQSAEDDLLYIDTCQLLVWGLGILLSMSKLAASWATTEQKKKTKQKETE